MRISDAMGMLAGRQVAVHDSIGKAKAFLLAQQATRTVFKSSTLIPDDLCIDRTVAGIWTGTFATPPAPDALPYAPILLKGPLFFPIIAGSPVVFNGVVDIPFASMDDFAGNLADGATNWGSYFVVGSVSGQTQFITKILANATWMAKMADPPSGSWSFQLITFADSPTAEADMNWIPVGNPWLETERPGDVRDYYAIGYSAGTPLFTDVALHDASPCVITGKLSAFGGTPGFTYKILATSETDVEYAWALADAVSGAFAISKDYPFGGKIKLRLVELDNGRAVRVVGQVWVEENAAAVAVYPDVRVEYRSITSTIPSAPNSIAPARLDGTWSAALVQHGISRVSLVDVNTKRIFGEYTMPSGLIRSFNVPAADAGQSTKSVYYDSFNDTCFLYDQAVVLIACLQLGERKAAVQLVDALLVVQNPDGSYPFANNQSVLFEHDSSFIRIGAVAWVCYALLLADQPQYRDWFSNKTTDAAKACLAYILSYRNALGLVQGGKGRYLDGVLDRSYVVPWWSSEHNFDTWWCLDLADTLYGSDDLDYRSAANTIKASLETDKVGWDAASGIFWQGGTVANAANTPDGMHALDMMSWGGVLLDKWGRASDTAAAIARMYTHYYVVDETTGLSGFATFVPLDGYSEDTILTPWYEGSFGAACAIRTQDPPHANGLMAALVRAQRPDGSYPYAVQIDSVNDIHTFPCLIAAAWNIVAFSGLGTPYNRVLWN